MPCYVCDLVILGKDKTLSAVIFAENSYPTGQFWVWEKYVDIKSICGVPFLFFFFFFNSLAKNGKLFSR